MKIEIGDVAFDVSFTVNSVCELESLMGKGFGEIVSLPGYSSLRALMWCALTENMKGLTVAKAGTLLQEYLRTHSVEDFMETVGAAIEEAGFLKAQGTTAPAPATKARARAK